MNNVKEISILLQSESINGSPLVPSTGQSLLYWASGNPETALLESLLSDECNLNEIHDNQPLFIRFFENHGYEGLIALGDIPNSVINQENSNGATALTLSYIYKDYESFEYLADHGAMISDLFAIGRYWRVSPDHVFN